VRITASTRLFAVLGDPVRHSLSPALHNAAFAAAGVDAVYVALQASAAHVAPLIASIARAGGGNITIPHKQLAAASVDLPEPVVSRTGACNTFWGEGDRVHGDNTDVAGFRAAALRLTGSVHGARSLVLGAGGAARAVVCALLDDGGTVDVVARNTAAAVELRQRLDPEGKRVRLYRDVAEVRGERFDLLVNTTPLGLHAADPQPVRLDAIRPPAALMDVVYAPGGTPLEQSARSLGIPSCDGHDMLVAQAAAAFERWFNIPAPIAAMRQALSATAG
jgi:shikimate dehydrogenase